MKRLTARQKASLENPHWTKLASDTELGLPNMGAALSSYFGMPDPEKAREQNKEKARKVKGKVVAKRKREDSSGIGLPPSLEANRGSNEKSALPTKKITEEARKKKTPAKKLQVDSDEEDEDEESQELRMKVKSNRRYQASNSAPSSSSAQVQPKRELKQLQEKHAQEHFVGKRVSNMRDTKSNRMRPITELRKIANAEWKRQSNAAKWAYFVGIKEDVKVKPHWFIGNVKAKNDCYVMYKEDQLARHTGTDPLISWTDMGTEKQRLWYEEFLNRPRQKVVDDDSADNDSENESAVVGVVWSSSESEDNADEKRAVEAPVSGVVDNSPDDGGNLQTQLPESISDDEYEDASSESVGADGASDSASAAIPIPEEESDDIEEEPPQPATPPPVEVEENRSELPQYERFRRLHGSTLDRESLWSELKVIIEYRAFQEKEQVGFYKRRSLVESREKGERVEFEERDDEFEEDLSSLPKAPSPYSKKKFKALGHARLQQMVDESSGAKTSRTKNPWTDEEIKALCQGVSKYGVKSWAAILADPVLGRTLKSRTNVNLKDKYRQISVTDATGTSTSGG